ncbi:response regulator [Nemorincola caseinilytica]|uniref:Response regulator n=1 Tax=Nemorincola caseinilytica TaxID=2054315 RepID=A0ABP8N605_9BACT
MDKALIVIAEDDVDDRFLVKAAFDESGYTDTLVFVENGVELTDLLQKKLKEGNMPHLILLDLNMPKKDGREALREIKQDPAFCKIPVIIFSTTNNIQEIARCYETGANSYITKPNSFEQLINILSTVRNYWIEINSSAI